MKQHDQTFGLTTGLVNLAAAGVSAIVGTAASPFVSGQFFSPLNGTIYYGGQSLTGANMIGSMALLPSTGLTINGPAPVYFFGIGASAGVSQVKFLTNGFGATLGY